MSTMQFTDACEHDLPALIQLLADDVLGSARETPSEVIDPAYLKAFKAIQSDPSHRLVVMRRGETVCGMLQLTWLPSLTQRGLLRCQIEGVRIARSERGKGLGHVLFEWAIEQARNAGCGVVQLSSDKRRPEAIRFYRDLGFAASHEGMKLWL